MGKQLHVLCPLAVLVLVAVTVSGEEDGTLFNPFNTFEEGCEFIVPAVIR